jgi:hypothetical protein
MTCMESYSELFLSVDSIIPVRTALGLSSFGVSAVVHSVIRTIVYHSDICQFRAVQSDSDIHI